MVSPLQKHDPNQQQQQQQQQVRPERLSSVADGAGFGGESGAEDTSQAESQQHERTFANSGVRIQVLRMRACP